MADEVVSTAQFQNEVLLARGLGRRLLDPLLLEHE
jgi:hypothetical protein